MAKSSHSTETYQHSMGDNFLLIHAMEFFYLLNSNETMAPRPVSQVLLCTRNGRLKSRCRKIVEQVRVAFKVAHPSS